MTSTPPDASNPATLRLWSAHHDPTRHLNDLLTGPVVTLTGTRSSTDYGNEITTDLVTQLATTGTTILTGIGYGIEEAAARAALDTATTLILVLVSGAHTAGPVTNRPLLHETILRGGAVLTLEEDTTPPSRATVRRRHTLLGQLPGAVILTEAGHRGAALDIATTARAHDIPVWATPGPLTSAASGGTHHLIRTGGATLLTHTHNLGAPATLHGHLPTVPVVAVPGLPGEPVNQ